MNISEKKIKVMAAKILSSIESVIDDDISNLSPDCQINFTGSDLQMIRNEVLNAAGDTIRALRDIGTPGAFTKEELGALLSAEGDNYFLIKHQNFGVLNGLRQKFDAGIVYNHMYICSDMGSLINKVIPYLDQLYGAKFNIMGGNYKKWRDGVCRAYLGEKNGRL